jgi:hypothetical protein
LHSGRGAPILLPVFAEAKNAIAIIATKTSFFM